MSTARAGAQGAAPDTSELVERHLRHLASLVLSRLQEVLEHQERLVVSTKTAVYDLVTDVDRSVEAWLWEEVHRVFPEDGFLGEEHGWRLGPTGARDWVVDPIDGTTNFASGLPWACCSIAALCSGSAGAGVIVDPYRAEIHLTASAAKGSEVNGETVRVSPGGDLEGKVVLLEVPSGVSPSVLQVVEQAVLRRGGAPRVMGSGALALASVAAGRAQATVHAGPNIWDVAAGVALVEHAGGVVLGAAAPYLLGAPGPLVAGSAETCEVLQPLLVGLDTGVARSLSEREGGGH